MRPTLPPSAALDSGPLCARLDQAPLCAALLPPCRRLPPIARPPLPPSAATSSSPLYAAASRPPLRRPSPLAARRYPPQAGKRAATLAPRCWRSSGDGRPRFGPSPAACASGRGLRRGWPFLAPPSRLRRPRLGCGWTRFPAHFVAGTRSAKVGGVLRGTLPRSCARLRRASGRGARGYSY